LSGSIAPATVVIVDAIATTGCTMVDHFQLTSIVAAAIRECLIEAREQGASQQQQPGNMEEANCIAKAVLTAITDAGFEITAK
jgi:hypothetical protein